MYIYIWYIYIYIYICMHINPVPWRGWEWVNMGSRKGSWDISQHIRFESHRKNDLKIWFLQGDELFKCINEVMNSNTTSLQWLDVVRSWLVNPPWWRVYPHVWTPPDWEQFVPVVWQVARCDRISLFGNSMQGSGSNDDSNLSRGSQSRSYMIDCGWRLRLQGPLEPKIP